MVQLLFSEIRVFGDSGRPVMILKEAQGTRHLAIWVTASAATAVLSALEADDPDHPATHDLMLDTLAAFDVVPERLDILGEAEGVFDAQLQLNGTKVTCRVSDGVAIALRSGATIHVDDAVLARCALPGPDAAQGSHELGDSDVQEFLQFLDTVEPGDFEKEL